MTGKPDYKNGFFTPNQLIDRDLPGLSDKDFRVVMFLLRKIIGWQKDSDLISVSQIIKGTGINRKNTILKAVQSLESEGYIVTEKQGGKVTRYSLGWRFDRLHLVPPVAESATGGTCDGEPVAPSATATGGTRCHPQNTANLNTQTQNDFVCEKGKIPGQWFIDVWPVKGYESEIAINWPVLNSTHALDDNRERIEQDIEKRSKHDRAWLAGFYHKPVNYIKKQIWLTPITYVDGSSSGAGVEEWQRMPRANDQTLVDWAARWGYPAANSGEDWEPWRKRLQAAVADREREQQQTRAAL